VYKKKNAAIKRSAEETALNILGAVSAAMQLRDEYTFQHQHKVADVCALLAEHMGLDQNFVFGLRVGAFLHDIGKIALPLDILNKPGKLNRAELDLIRMHPEYGGRIFAGVDLPWPVTDMVMQHHERLDGSGYPRGLKGDQIYLSSRFIAVADTLDAMSMARPYRYAPGLKAALRVLGLQKGHQYDAAIVTAAEELFGDEAVGDDARLLFDETDSVPGAPPSSPSSGFHG